MARGGPVGERVGLPPSIAWYILELVDAALQQFLERLAAVGPSCRGRGRARAGDVQRCLSLSCVLALLDFPVEDLQVPIKLGISKADLRFEAGFPKPEFGLFRDVAALLDHLYRHLEPYGLRLTDIRVERGTGTVGDQHILLYLFNYSVVVRVRVERIEVTCSDLPQELVRGFTAAVLDVLRSVKSYRSDLSFRTYAIVIGLHAKLEGHSVREYLARFVANAPEGLGPATGSGAVFYFGTEADRLLSTVTADVSAVVPDGLFVRVHAVWDAGRVVGDALPMAADSFLRQALESLGLQLPV